MTIIQIGQYPLSPDIIRGGVEASVYGLAQEQSRSNKVYVMDVPRLRMDDCIVDSDRIVVHRFRNPGPHQLNSIKRAGDILETILQIKPDICHIHGTGIFSWSIYKLLKEESIPVVLTVHGLVAVEKGKALRQHFSLKTAYQYVIQRHYERRLLNDIGQVIVDTDYVRKAIEGYGLNNKPQMYVIPQGIDEKYFTLNCSASSKTILAVGSISRRKGHMLLIKAFNVVAQEDKEMQLIICGVMSDTAYYNELTAYISTLNCKDRIELMVDVPKAEVLEHYKRAHVFALHSQEESQGIVFAEAMATGLPVVATRVGGISNVVEEGVTGYLSEYGDISGFASLLLKANSDNSDWHRMSGHCKQSSVAYSWKTIEEGINAIYSKIIK